MQPAVERFSGPVERGEFTIPQFDVISNVDAEPYRDVATIKQNLVASITSEVRWHEPPSACYRSARPRRRVGASGVLGPLMKRLPNAPPVLVVSDHAGIEKLRGTLAEDVVRA